VRYGSPVSMLLVTPRRSFRVLMITPPFQRTVAGPLDAVYRTFDLARPLLTAAMSWPRPAGDHRGRTEITALSIFGTRLNSAAIMPPYSLGTVNDGVRMFTVAAPHDRTFHHPTKVVDGVRPASSHENSTSSASGPPNRLHRHMSTWSRLLRSLSST
jgi:hypothetical protein